MRLGVLLGACAVLGGCATSGSSVGNGVSSRMPTSAAVVAAARGQSWGAELKQIPATVVEMGELDSVPYVSFAGPDIELNVYGDPERPAGIEIGTKSESPELRAALRSFVAGLLPEADGKRLAALSEGRREEADGLTLEQTLPTAPDAFGAWWVTASHPDGLKAAKATVGELNEVAVAPSPEMDLTPFIADVGTHPGFVGYARFRPAGKRVWATAYFKRDGVYQRRK